jgi:DMSO/TMAO reductase YedYZ molybdopterin-dependent catalytic subunit
MRKRIAGLSFIFSRFHGPGSIPILSLIASGYIVDFSIDPDWWESIDVADAMHPQTFLAYGMNGDELPVGNGGPLRLRRPRQLGYKSVKFITRLTVTDSLKRFGKGLGSDSPEGGYACYAGN